jgi:signal transduction histidine kinase
VELHGKYAARGDTQALRELVDNIADQLCVAVSGDFNFTVKADVPDETLDKLAMLINFVVEAARRGLTDLRERNARLAELDQMKSTFLANVSHELRTPLTLIMGPLRSILAGEYGKIPERAFPVAERMLRNTDRLAILVNDLLDFSKLEARQMRLSPVPLDPGLFIQGLIEELRPLADERGVRLHDQVAWNGLLALLDAKMLEKIFLNLMSNALKFTPAEGEVWASLQLAGNRIRIEVRDTGPGISEEKQELVFQRFRQVDGGTNRRFEGTGLGLAIVKEFAELMGGEVVLRSSVGNGSSFTVHLPFELAEETETIPDGPLADVKSKVASLDAKFGLPLVDRSAAAIGRTPWPPDRRRPAVLVVEDNCDMRNYISEILSPDFQIRTAGNGNEALTELRDQQPDVILSDVMMPQMDGLELLKRVKSHSEWRSIPIIMVTARAGREGKIEGLEEGADDYLCKPFDAMELKSRVKSAYRMHELYKEVEKANRELWAANKELEAFSYSVSHDLRAPLRSMDGFSRTLLEHHGDRLNDRGKDYLRRIRESAQRMAQLIDDILDLSRMGRAEMKIQPIDLSEIATNVVANLPRDESRKVVFAIEPGLQAAGDPNLLRVALENLLGNSWKFTSKHPQAKIEFGTVQQDGKRAFFVRDDGAGFDMSFCDKLFAPFQRLHDHAEFPGTGVGLALVQRIVRRHGGEVWAKGAVENGATVYFTLDE